MKENEFLNSVIMVAKEKTSIDNAQLILNEKHRMKTYILCFESKYVSEKYYKEVQVVNELLSDKKALDFVLESYKSDFLKESIKSNKILVNIE